MLTAYFIIYSAILEISILSISCYRNHKRVKNMNYCHLPRILSLSRDCDYQDRSLDNKAAIGSLKWKQNNAFWDETRYVWTESSQSTQMIWKRRVYILDKMLWSVREGAHAGHIRWILALVSDDWNFIETEVGCQNTFDVLLELYSERKPDNSWTSYSLDNSVLFVAG